MTQTLVALNTDTCEDWQILNFLQIISVNDDELADLEDNPSYNHHDWYDDKKKISIKVE